MASGRRISTVRPPSTDWTINSAIPASPARCSHRRSGCRRQVSQAAAANNSTSPPATSRCRCSQKTPPVISGIMVPKQVGQSGQARLDPVACTMLPRSRSPRVHPSTAARAMW